MGCMVCGGASVDEDALTCTACREYAQGRRLHAGFEAPSDWGRTAQHYVATMAWLDAAAQRYGIPPPATLEEATGTWAHFVLGVHALNSGKLAHAAAEAGYVAAGAEVPGFPGMKDAARRIRDAATQGLESKGIAPVRTFRAMAQVELPDLPAEADFSKLEWQHYQAAVACLRRHDVKAARFEITKGLRINGYEDTTQPATWFLKRLGAAISDGMKVRGTYDLRHVPALPDDVREILDHYGVPIPTGADLSHPAWTLVAQVHIALDNRSWVSAYRRIEEARRTDMPASQRALVEAAVLEAEKRIPVKRKPDQIGLPDAPDVRPASRVRMRNDKGRARWR